MNNSKATLSLTLCSSSDNTDGSVLLANWWPTDEDFMWVRILPRMLTVTDCSTVSSSDYKHAVTSAQPLLDSQQNHTACYITPVSVTQIGNKVNNHDLLTPQTFQQTIFMPSQTTYISTLWRWGSPPTAEQRVGGGIRFSSCPSGRPFVNTYFTWCNIPLLSE